MVNKFEKFNLDKNIIKSLNNMKYEEPSKVQDEVIPFLLNKNDIIVKSKTGSGKTASFAIPIVEKIDINNNCVQGLIIAPTRELALQIKEEMETPTGNKSRARFIHLVPNGRPVDILLDKEMVLEDVEYKEVTPYTDVDPKTYQVDVLLNENGQLIRQIRVTINPGRVYSFYGLGNKPNFQIFQSLDGATFMI